MKKSLFLVILFLLPFLGTGILSAKEIPVEEARQTASRFWQSAPATRGSTPSWQMILDSEELQTRSSGTAPAYYVFDNAAGPGFVIVAGDDVAMPVLGYSFENEFPQGPLPENLKMWLDGVRKNMIRARSDRLPAESAVTQAWNATRVGSPVVEIETALWDQEEPYNLKCPTCQGAATYTGCTATAVAIAMRYHQWPQQGVGTLPAYTTLTHSIAVPEVVLGETYDWENMPLQYADGYSQQEAQAVASLMRDCAVMLQSDFGPLNSDGTSAYSTDIPGGLISYMGYDKQTRWIYRPDYTTAEWNAHLQKELDEKRPVIYSGYNPTAGHAFILDGYTDDNYYRVNWGWSGYCNGYFLLTALDPEGQGAGGSDHYNDDQLAIVGMQKEMGGEQVATMRFVRFTAEEDGREYNGISAEGSFIPGEAVWIYAGLICNIHGYPFKGEYQVAIADRNDNIIETVYSKRIEVDPGYGEYVYYNYQVKDYPLPGQRIRAYYRSDDMTEWALVRGNDEEGCVWDLPIADEYTIEESTRFTYDKKTRTMHLKVKDGVSAGMVSEEGTDLSDLCRAEGEGDAREILVDTSTLPAGSYVLTLTKGAERKELRITLPEATKHAGNN